MVSRISVVVVVLVVDGGSSLLVELTGGNSRGSGRFNLSRSDGVERRRLSSSSGSDVLPSRVPRLLVLALGFERTESELGDGIPA